MTHAAPPATRASRSGRPRRPGAGSSPAWPSPGSSPSSRSGGRRAGSVQIVNVVYVGLIDPVDISTPLPSAILVGAVARSSRSIVITSLLGEITAGGWAARRIVLDAGSVPRVRDGRLGDLVSRPALEFLPSLLTTGVLILDLAAMLAAVDLAWTDRPGRPLAEFRRSAVGTGLALVPRSPRSGLSPSSSPA